MKHTANNWIFGILIKIQYWITFKQNVQQIQIVRFFVVVYFFLLLVASMGILFLLLHAVSTIAAQWCNVCISKGWFSHFIFLPRTTPRNCWTWQLTLLLVWLGVTRYAVPNDLLHTWLSIKQEWNWFEHTSDNNNERVRQDKMHLCWRVVCVCIMHDSDESLHCHTVSREIELFVGRVWHGMAMYSLGAFDASRAFEQMWRIYACKAWNVRCDAPAKSCHAMPMPIEECRCVARPNQAVLMLAGIRTSYNAYIYIYIVVHSLPWN